MDVVVKDGFADLVVCKPGHRIGVELDAEPRRPRHGEQPVRHVEGLPEDVLALVGPGHPLGRHGVLLNANEWDAALSVHALIARQLLYPSSPLPSALEPIPPESDAIVDQELTFIPTVRRVLPKGEAHRLTGL